MNYFFYADDDLFKWKKLKYKLFSYKTKIHFKIKFKDEKYLLVNKILLSAINVFVRLLIF